MFGKLFSDRYIQIDLYIQGRYIQVQMYFSSQSIRTLQRTCLVMRDHKKLNNISKITGPVGPLGFKGSQGAADRPHGRHAWVTQGPRER